MIMKWYAEKWNDPAKKIEKKCSDKMDSEWVHKLM